MRLVGGVKIAVTERSAAALGNARVTARAVICEQCLAAADRAFAEFLVEIRDQVAAGVVRLFRIRGLALIVARGVQIHLVGLCRQEEIGDVRQPVLDRAEIGAVAPALADDERRLAEAALLGIDLAEVCQMIHPALLGA